MLSLPVLNLENCIAFVVDQVRSMESPAEAIAGNCPSVWGLEFRPMCRGNSRPPTDERCRKCWCKALAESLRVQA
jgi:hypothetical protein